MNEETFYYCVKNSWYKGKANGKSERSIKNFLSRKYPGENVQLRIGINDYVKIRSNWCATRLTIPVSVSLIVPEEKETILSIEETLFKTTKTGRTYERGYEGYVINTNKRIIQIGIENESQCCEVWGYVASEDDFSQFIGAEIVSVYATDDKLASINITEQTKMEACLAFFNVNTSKGLLQFAMYNAHNGYYGHDCVISIDNVVEHRETI